MSAVSRSALSVPSKSHLQLVATELTASDSEDSGICLEDNSPRGSDTTAQPNRTGRLDFRRILPSSSESSSTSSPHRLLPTVGTLPRVKHFRVRFADQVDASPCSSTDEVPPTRFVSPTVAPLPPTFTPRNTSSPNNYIRQQPRNDVWRGGTVRRQSADNSALEPPSYNVALQRLRLRNPRESYRDAVIRQTQEDTISRKFRNRSSSLPRGRLMLDETEDVADVIQDVERMRLRDESWRSMTKRRLPPAPIVGETHNTLQRLHRTVLPHEFVGPHRFAPATRHNSVDALNHVVNTMPLLPTECAVEAQLVALDARGFRTVLIEKKQPGPFGFYIATGVMNGQRGIYISRVTLPSLCPVLSVGDEILYVDDQLVKGTSLECVQSLIAGKTRVLIVLLPSIAPAGR